MTNKELREHLTGRGACRPAMGWLGDRDLETTWRECERADWLMWLIGPHIPRTDLVLLACQCARTALVRVPDGEDRPRICVETAEKWTRGEATIEEVMAAAEEVRAVLWAEWWAEREDVISALRAAVRAAEAAEAVEAGAEEPWAVRRASWAASWAAESAAAHPTMCAIIRAKYQVCPDLRKGGA